MDIAFKIALYAFALCGVWFVGLTAYHVALAIAPKVVAWFKSSSKAATVDLAGFEARIQAQIAARFDAIEAKLGSVKL